MRGPKSIIQIAAAVGAALRSDRDAEARRIAFYFVRQFDSASDDDRLAMTATRPSPTGDARYDALLAALTEHVCVQHNLRVPRWVDDPERFLEPWWFMSGLPSLHASALAQSPISFARRGVFICDGALTYA